MAGRAGRILIVDPDRHFVEDARQLLDDDGVVMAGSLGEAAEIAEGERVDVALLGPSFGNDAGVRAAATLRAADPGIGLVLAADVVTNRVLLAALQTGLADVLDTPLTAGKLEAALARAGEGRQPSHAAAATPPVEAEPAAQPPPMPAELPPVAAAPAVEVAPGVEVVPAAAPLPGVELDGGREPVYAADLLGHHQVIVVMAGKGGSGKTVTATNLALALTAAVDGDRVAIVDADLQFGDVALLLHMEPALGVGEVARRAGGLLDTDFDALLLHHPSGLRVLPASPQGGAEQVSAEAVVRVVEMMRRLCRYVVVDTGSIFEDGLLTLLGHADAAVLVVDADPPGLKNAGVALNLLREGDYPMGRLHLVVNRVDSRAKLGIREVERSLGIRPAAAIPADRLVPRSVTEGIPVVALSPRSRAARAFNGLATRFLPQREEISHRRRR